MENILYVLRCVGIAAVCVGILLVLAEVVRGCFFNRKNRQKAERILKKLQEDGIEEGEFEIDGAKVVVKNEDGIICSSIALPVEEKCCSRFSEASFHFMLAGFCCLSAASCFGLWFCFCLFMLRLFCFILLD